MSASGIHVIASNGTERTFDREKVRLATRALLEAIGENPERPGLIDTPDRVARAWEEFITYRDTRAETMFDQVSSGWFVMVRGINVWSICEHHLLPFRCRIAIAYRPYGNRLLGLSKFARIANKFAHQLQLQEQMTTQIGTAVQKASGSKTVAVIVQGEHLCMVSRGIKAHGSEMFSAFYAGEFEDIDARREFLTLASWNPLD
jgi:GTP cyclohydrolase I